MTILVNLRQLGKKRQAVAAVPFVLPSPARSVRELIAGIVRACVAAYNERVRKGETGPHC